VITSHILGLFNKTLSFLEKGIIPVYVFDGKPPQLKQKILDTRRQIRKKAMTKLEDDAISDVDRIKYFKRCVSITREQMDQCRELLELMGIPYVDAIEEADSQLSYLCKTNMVYAVLTEDMDILTFGSPRVIRNLSTSKKIPLEIELSKVLTTLKLTHEQFIELCILFGCDYCMNVSDIKTSVVYETYMKHKNIEKTLQELKTLNYNVPDVIDYNDAKEYFSNNINNINYNLSFELKEPKINKLLELLVDQYSLIKYKVLNKLTKLSEFYLKYKLPN
jgi:flap endonuclease-1